MSCSSYLPCFPGCPCGLSSKQSSIRAAQADVFIMASPFEWLGAAIDHTDDLRPPKIRSTKDTLGGHWQRLDFGTPAITWLTCWPQPAHVALPHLRQVTCRHIVRSSLRVDRTVTHHTPRGLVFLCCDNSSTPRNLDRAQSCHLPTITFIASEAEAHLSAWPLAPLRWFITNLDLSGEDSPS